MSSIQELASGANRGLEPGFARLPAIVTGLESAVTRAERVFTLDRPQLW